MSGVSRKTKKRLMIILGTFTFMFLLVIIRLFWLQVIDGKKYQDIDYGQISSNQVIAPERGLIYDRNNQELALNIPVDTISMNPDAVRGSKISVDRIADSISGILHIDRNKFLQKLNKKDQYELVVRKAEKADSEKLKQWLKDNKTDGFYFTQEDKRVYPNKNLAAQVIGFTGIDNQGLSGVELSMERYLLGQPGFSTQYVDANGQKLPMSKEYDYDVQDGLNVVLTIDADLQSYTEKALQKAIDDFRVVNGGIAIAMDPRNGQILAMASKPDFDLNNPFSLPSGSDKNLSKDKVKEIEKKLWTNKAVSYTYEPGSTFKSITASASLEEGIVNPKSEVVDKPVLVSGWTIKSDGGHGKETFEQSVYNSDNPVFVKLAMTLGLDKFYNYVKDFGFFSKTGIDLPGEAMSIFQPRPVTIDMAAASFGQSFQVTPIQLITAYTAIENGGTLVKPQIIKELTDSKGNVVKTFDTRKVRNVISEQTSETLRGILEGVVTKGTGTDAFIKDYRIAGKTGTSETFQNGKRSKQVYIASFMGFAPADNPRISVLVVLDHPSVDSYYGGKVAAPVASKIIKYALDDLNWK
ncbi:MAG TPA: penicillin-binding transpeptidase domain-containing protein [Ruminiclostridium sp.]|nr:penicillin-binding transpeptidase domain-containing protein [Ruminiclostridium sp.]